MRPVGHYGPSDYNAQANHANERAEVRQADNLKREQEVLDSELADEHLAKHSAHHNNKAARHDGHLKFLMSNRAPPRPRGPRGRGGPAEPGEHHENGMEAHAEEMQLHGDVVMPQAMQTGTQKSGLITPPDPGQKQAQQVKKQGDGGGVGKVKHQVRIPPNRPTGRSLMPQQEEAVKDLRKRALQHANAGLLSKKPSREEIGKFLEGQPDLVALVKSKGESQCVSLPMMILQAFKPQLRRVKATAASVDLKSFLSRRLL